MDDRGANGAVGGEMTDHEEGSIRARWVESRFECANSTRGNCAFVSAGLKSQLHRDFQSELRREHIDSWHPPLPPPFACRAGTTSWVCSGPCQRTAAMSSGGRCPARRDSGTPRDPRARYAQIWPPRFRNDDVRFHSHLAPIPDPVSRDPLPLNTRDPSIHRRS